MAAQLLRRVVPDVARESAADAARRSRPGSCCERWDRPPDSASRWPSWDPARLRTDFALVVGVAHAEVQGRKHAVVEKNSSPSAWRPVFACLPRRCPGRRRSSRPAVGCRTAKRCRRRCSSRSGCRCRSWSRTNRRRAPKPSSITSWVGLLPCPSDVAGLNLRLKLSETCQSASKVMKLESELASGREIWS